MKTPEEIISDEEVESVHANANFGPSYTKREVINMGVLKCAAGYYQGHTSKTICERHGLIKEKSYTLTRKGREYLWAAFQKDNF